MTDDNDPVEVAAFCYKEDNSSIQVQLEKSVRWISKSAILINSEVRHTGDAGWLMLEGDYARSHGLRSS